jgi:hypothetical protein
MRAWNEGKKETQRGVLLMDDFQEHLGAILTIELIKT